ncbi:MAG: hypothetical protein C0501_28315 [Isosphaera sp.]|nr:hypothetical protein [Isosphaera sp.]
MTDTPPAVRALVAVLDQLAELVGALTDGQYTTRPVGFAAGAISGHVRHNLDHVAALLAGLRAGRLDYDRRERGTAVERDRAAAVTAVGRLRAELLVFPWADAPPALPLAAVVGPDLPAVEVRTTPEREVVFVLSHTVHHNALIAVLARLAGADPPAEFGLAPATVAHQRSRPCAP